MPPHLLGIRVDRVSFAHRPPHLRVAHQHHVEHALVLVRELVLAQLPHALVRVDRHRPRRRLEIAAEDLHERRLAAAVGADQAIAVATAELHVDVLEEGLAPNCMAMPEATITGRLPKRKRWK